MRLNSDGRLREDCRAQIPWQTLDVAAHVFVVMPNHVHGVIVIMERDHGVCERQGRG